MIVVLHIESECSVLEIAVRGVPVIRRQQLNVSRKITCGGTDGGWRGNPA